MEKRIKKHDAAPRKKDSYTEPLLVKHEPLRELTGKSDEKENREKEPFENGALPV